MFVFVVGKYGVNIDRFLFLYCVWDLMFIMVLSFISIISSNMMFIFIVMI